MHADICIAHMLSAVCAAERHAHGCSCSRLAYYCVWLSRHATLCWSLFMVAPVPACALVAAGALACLTLLTLLLLQAYWPSSTGPTGKPGCMRCSEFKLALMQVDYQVYNTLILGSCPGLSQFSITKWWVPNIKRGSYRTCTSDFAPK